MLLHSACGRVGYQPGDDASGQGQVDGATSDGDLQLLSAGFVGYDKVELVFDRAVDATDALDVARYSLVPERPSGLMVMGAEVSSGGTVVTLSLSKNHLPLAYDLSVEALATDGTSVGPVVEVLVGDKSRVVFQSSEAGTGDLSTWTSADSGLAGTAAADSVCANLAATEGFVGTFVAGISDSVAAAGCRMQGVTGDYPACLGTGTLAAGPWINPAGNYVTASYDDGLALDFYNTATLTEKVVPSTTTGSWTATYTDGRFSSDRSCQDWSSAQSGDTAIMGHSVYGVSPFGSFTFSGCTAQHSLMCLQAGVGGFSNVPHPPVAGKYAFATSTSGPGDMGAWSGVTQVGIAGADQTCNARAAAAGLPGSYVAWLSDSTTDAYCHLIGTEGKLPGCNGGSDLAGPWVTTRGVRIAVNASSLRSTPLEQPIHCDEFGDSISSENIYTGTNSTGASSGLHCGDWQDSGAPNGSIGETTKANSRSWTDVNDRVCTTQLRIYCFQVN